MSNRMIKDSMLVSDKIASLSDFEFRLWIGLILSVDDMGRGDARAAIIKGRVFPLRERVSLRDIEDALHGLAAKGCVSLYTVGGKPYFWFPTWGKHQRIRDVKPKYPGPEEEDSRQDSPRRCAPPPSERGAQGAAQGTACGSSRQTAADCGKARPETETETKPKPNQTEPQTEPQTETETEDETEPRAREGVSVVDVVVGAVGGKLSQKARAELAGFLDSMGEECVVRAVETAQEAGKPTWGYIRGVLEHKQDWGVKSAEEWDRQEETRAQWLRRKHESRAIAGTPRDVQPSPERAKKSADWLDNFLSETEGGS